MACVQPLQEFSWPLCAGRRTPLTRIHRPHAHSAGWHSGHSCHDLVLSDRLLAVVLTVVAVVALPGRAAAQQQTAATYPYILIDLGTFGGPNSYLNESGLGGWPIISPQGAVFGSADTPTPDP